jgi:hypothetical protein
MRTSGTSYLLFGSVARGEAEGGSDVDLLVLPRDERAPRLGRNASSEGAPSWLSLHVYTEDALHSLFERGSLFALHLKLEGKVLSDPGARLSRILAVPVKLDVDSIRASLQAESALLHATDLDLRAERTHGVAKHLLRTAVFAECARRGVPTFSAVRAGQVLGDPRLPTLLSRSPVAGRRVEALRTAIELYAGAPSLHLGRDLRTLSNAGLHFSVQLTSATGHHLTYDPGDEASSALAAA